MTISIQDRYEIKRGCGFRKPGGMYLVSGGLVRDCGKLPLALDVCPTCGTGIKPARGWTWVNGTALFAGKKCYYDDGTSLVRQCKPCPLSKAIGRCGLLWVGERYYPSPGDFTAEAARQGVSRRISAIPHDFKIGKTLVLFAHRKAIENPDQSWSAGIFHAFTPTAIEYVVRDDDDEKTLRRLMDRGVTLVRVHPIDRQMTFEAPVSDDGAG